MHASIAFALTSGEISGNTAGGNGGGIYLSAWNPELNWNDTLTYYYVNMNSISGGVIIGNTAGVDGGGVYAGSVHYDEGEYPIILADADFIAELDVSGAKISENTAENNGGGIWINDLENLTVAQDVQFKGNTAVNAYYMNETDDITMHEQKVATLGRSASPSGKPAFTYAYNNYDIVYLRGTIDSDIFNIIYKANGGNVSDYKGFVEVGSYTVLGNNATGITRSGYTFRGWSTSANGSNGILSAGEDISIDSDVILYAQWRIIDDSDSDSYSGDDSGSGSTGGGGNTSNNITSPAPTNVKNPTYQEESDEDNTTTSGYTIGEGSHRDSNNPYDTIIIIGEGDVPLGTLEGDSHIKYLYGYPDKTVGAERNILRSEATAIFFRLLSDANKTTPKSQAFVDVSEDYWAVQYINSNYIKSWVDGYMDYSFKPEQYITRAEVVKMVNTMLTRLPDTLPKNINPYTDIAQSHWAYIHMIEASMEHEYARDNAANEYWVGYDSQ